MFKIVNSFENVDSSKFFTFSETELRGHSLKLYKTRFNANLGKFSFSNRIVCEWNMLPTVDVVSCKIVLNFKIKLEI